MSTEKLIDLYMGGGEGGLALKRGNLIKGCNSKSYYTLIFVMWLGAAALIESGNRHNNAINKSG